MGGDGKFWGVIVIFISLTDGFPQMWNARRSLNTGEESSMSSEEGYELRSDSREDIYNGDTESAIVDVSEIIDEDPEYGSDFEGDILGNPYERNGIPDEKYRWKNGLIQFYIHPDFSVNQTRLIYKALYEIRDHSCLIFHEITDDSSSADHLSYMTVPKGCSSFVGRQGGRQVIKLASACFRVGHGRVVHETLHAMGFYHEHTRADRDSYVTIHYKNLKKGKDHNFKIKPSNDFGTPYDYGSIMHYSKTAFAKSRGLITIEVLQQGKKIGQRKKISTIDAQKVDLMYEKECETRNNVHGMIKLWTKPNCGGKQFTSSDDIPDLKSNNKYSSVQAKGAWLVYEASNYGSGVVETVFSSTLACKSLATMASVNGKVGGFRFAGDRQDYRAETLTIYEREWFGGTATVFHRSEDFTNVQYTGALVVTGVIPWQVFDSVELTGSSRCVVPSPTPGEIAPSIFVYSTKGFGIPFNIRSVKLGCAENSYESI